MAGYSIYPAPGAGNGNPSQTPIPVTEQTTGDLFADITGGVTDFANAGASSATAAGDLEEAGAYETAEAIANSNARLAGVAGTVEQAQQGIQIRQTLGTQMSQVAAGGFGESGSALSLLRSSTQQGLLAQQITGVNAELQAAGYEQQGAASEAEAGAASGAATAASGLAASYAALGAASKTAAITTAAGMGVNIPGLGGLSATSIPATNPALITAGAQGGPTELGGQMVTPQHPYII
jgi:hypothetical protein